jgi:hypothetical protein
MASETVSQLTLPLREEEIVALMHEEKPQYSLFKLGFIDSISFKLLGYTKLGDLRKGPQVKQDVYLLKCKIHGAQIATPNGWSNKLVCPACLGEVHRDMELRSTSAVKLEDLDSVNELKKYLTKNNDNHK